MINFIRARTVGDEERVTDVELAGIAESLSVGKAQGPDGVKNQDLKVVVAKGPEMFRSAIQKCLDEGVLAEVWKRQSWFPRPVGI